MRREDRPAQLAGDISIAKSLGLEKPSAPALMANQGTAKANLIRTEVNSQQAPVYFLGSQVLEAVRDALNRRASDDFIYPDIVQIIIECDFLAWRQDLSYRCALMTARVYRRILRLHQARMLIVGCHWDRRTQRQWAAVEQT